MPRPLRGFLVAAAIALTVDLAIYACWDSEDEAGIAVWWAFNAPTMPCVFCCLFSLGPPPMGEGLGPWDDIALLGAFISSCVGWGLIGAGISWLIRPAREAEPGARVLSNGGGVRGWRARWLVPLLLLPPAAVFVIGRAADRTRGREQAEALFQGDEAVQIERLQIDYQQRRVVCSDPAVLRYLEGRIRHNNPVRGGGGTSYRLRLWFVGGGRWMAHTY